MLAARPVLPALLLKSGCLLVLVCSATICKIRMDEHGAASKSLATVPLILQGDKLKIFACGNDSLVADILWLRTVQLVGDKTCERSARLQELVALIHSINYLDPHFLPAYWFATFVIGGDEQKPHEASQILNYGMTHNPDSWELFFMAGINAYLYANDPQNAAEYYRAASAFPNSPRWLSRQAEILTRNIPASVKKIQTWVGIYSSVADKNVKAKAKSEIMTLWRRVYDDSPTEQLRKNAAQELQRWSETP